MFDQDKIDEARAILEKIYPADEVEGEMEVLRFALEAEKALQGSYEEGKMYQKVKDMCLF